MFTVGNEVNAIVFNPNNYDDVDKMWDDITAQLKILMRGEYILTMSMEDDLVVIDYDMDEFINAYGAANPVWMTAEQVSAFIDSTTDSTSDE